MSNMAGIYKTQKLLTLREYLGSPPVFRDVRVAHLVLCVVFFVPCFSVLPVSSVPNVPRVSGLSILDCPSVFSNVYLGET